MKSAFLIAGVSVLALAVLNYFMTKPNVATGDVLNVEDGFQVSQ